MAKRDWHPGELLEISGYFWKTCTLHAAVKLDVFTLIAEKQLTGVKVAEKLDTAPKGVERLLNALVAMGLLTKTNDTYSNTPSSLELLSKDSPKFLGHIIMHHHHLVEPWSQLAQCVESGKPIRERSSFSKAEWRESFLMGMFNMAMSMAPLLVPKVDISSRRHLLDLGGGPGTYAIHFCRHNPQLKATVFDLTTTRPFAEKTIKRFDLADRIDFVGGNYLKDDIEGSYDAAWLSHILHGEGPEGCRIIIEKAVSALQPGGTILVHEFILDDRSGGPLFPALFSLNMLIGTEGGQAYSEQEFRAMLEGTGVKEIRRLPFRGPNDSGLIAGTL